MSDVITIFRDGLASLLNEKGITVGVLDRCQDECSQPTLHYDIGGCRVIVRFGTDQAQVSLLSEQNCGGVGAAEYADPQFLEKLGSILDSCYGRNT